MVASILHRAIPFYHSLHLAKDLMQLQPTNVAFNFSFNWNFLEVKNFSKKY